MYPSGILHILNTESNRKLLVDLKPYNLCINYSHYRMLVQLHDISFFGFFFIEGYIRKERKQGLFHFPVVISKLIHQLVQNYVVHFIEIKRGPKEWVGCPVRHIMVNLKDVDYFY